MLSDTGLVNTAWHKADPVSAGQIVMQCAESHENRNAKRKNDAIQLMRLYDGEPVSLVRGSRTTAEDITDDPHLGDDVVDITLNIAQSLVDTLDAKIAGLEKTKGQFVTTDASWEVRRQAILADRFVEGQFDNRQGRFSDLWEVYRFAFRLAQASTRTAAVKFYSSMDEGKVCAEVHDCLSMWMDTPGAVYDYPTGMGEVTYWDADRLIDFVGDVYPGVADDIMKAKKQPKRALGLELLNDDGDDYTRSNCERVMVAEAWRFKYGKTDGRYIMTFPGAKEPLKFTPYKYEDPPFVFVGGQRSLTSFWHKTLIQPVVAPILRVNEILSAIDRAERLCPKGVMFYDPEEIKKEMLEVGDDYELIPVPGLSGMKGKPIYEAPAPFHPICLELVRFYIEQCYAIPGISEMHALADVKGDWSGAALRIRKQLINERFSTIQSAYIQALVVDGSKQIVRCAKEIIGQNGKFSSTWKGQGFMKEIDGKVLSVLDKYKYDVAVYPVSETKNTPESRAQLAEELMATQVITGDAYVNILKHFDTLGDTKGNDEQMRLVGIQIDKWLTAEPEEMKSRRFYRGPIRTMDLFAAVVQVNRAYMKAMADDVDDRRLSFFKRYLTELKKFLDIQAKQQGAAGAGGGAPSAPAQVGGPPVPAGAAPTGGPEASAAIAA